MSTKRYVPFTAGVYQIFNFVMYHSMLDKEICIIKDPKTEAVLFGISEQVDDSGEDVKISDILKQYHNSLGRTCVFDENKKIRGLFFYRTGVNPYIMYDIAETIKSAIYDYGFNVDAIAIDGLDDI